MKNQAPPKNRIIKATLMKVSKPQTFSSGDYFQLGFKTEKGNRILIVININAMGWSGNLSKSKFYYCHKSGDRLIKTSLKNPEHFIGKTFKITGFLQTLNENEKKYRLNPVIRIVYYPD